MKLLPITISPDLKLTLPCGTVALSAAQALRVADELAYRAFLKQDAERKERRAARQQGKRESR